MSLLLSIPVEQHGSLGIDLVRGLLRLSSELNNVDVSVSVVPGNKIAAVRNLQVKQFLESSHDELLMIDSDMVLDYESVNYLIESSQNEGVEVVSGVADKMTNGGPMPVLYHFTDDWGCLQDETILKRNPNEGPFRLKRGGAGAACLLIKRSALEKIYDNGALWFRDTLEEDRENPRYGELKMSEDGWFWRQCHEAGVSCWVDTRSYWGHVKPVNLKDQARLIHSARKA